MKVKLGNEVIKIAVTWLPGQACPATYLPLQPVVKMHLKVNDTTVI